MKFTIIALTVFFIVAAGGVFLLLLRKRQKNKQAHSHRQAESEKRQLKAEWAKAIVVDVQSDIVYGAATQAKVIITMNVQPQTGSAYRAITKWMIDIAVLSSIRQGREIAVTVDKEDHTIIYPHTSWATYICD